MSLEVKEDDASPVLVEPEKRRDWLAWYVRFSGSHSDKLLKILQWTLAFWDSTLSNEISWARYVTRLLDLPKVLEAVKNNSWELQNDQWPRTFRVLGKILTASMLLYYPMEHVAWYQWKKPTQTFSWRAETWSYWSCRFWGLYLIADSVQSLLMVRSNRDTPYHQTQLVRNACFALPCWQWSLRDWDTKPTVPARLMNLCMWLEAVVSLYQAYDSEEEL